MLFFFLFLHGSLKQQCFRPGKRGEGSVTQTAARLAVAVLRYMMVAARTKRFLGISRTGIQSACAYPGYGYANIAKKIIFFWLIKVI